MLNSKKEINVLTIEQIASITHEMNRNYCKLLGDESHLAWSRAPKWQKDSAILGVTALIDNPDLTPEEMHEGWKEVKLKDGWKYGEVKDARKKTHPCLVDTYEDLPIEDRIKDELFSSIVKTLM